MRTEKALVGRTIGGRYHVDAFIGEGAMAEVYRASQDGAPREVALKVMHQHLASDATFVGRFRREAKAAARLDHPNTVRIVDWGVDGGLLYMAMELLEGKDLFDVLAAERRLPEARAVRVLIEVCDALSAAHAQGIVHRDLKPENIMMMPDPARPDAVRVKVLDFGIAKIVERERVPGESEPPSISTSELTTVGVAVGTPQYMSPEQCRGEAVDARSDVYSCGTLLYQLLTGRTPFNGEVALDIALKQVREPPMPPSQWVPGLDPGLEAVILKALEKWPAQRHQSARELRDELARLLPTLSEGSARRPAALAPSPAAVAPSPATMAAPSPAAMTPSPAAMASSPAAAAPSPAAMGVWHAAMGPSSAAMGPSLAATRPLPADMGPSLAATRPLPADMGPSLAAIRPLPADMAAPPANMAPARADIAPSRADKAPSAAISAPATAKDAPPAAQPGPRRRGLPPWMLVPAALVLGVVVGLGVFLMTR
jgi:serine/threonine-protein kinase